MKQLIQSKRIRRGRKANELAVFFDKDITSLMGLKRDGLVVVEADKTKKQIIIKIVEE